MPVEIEGQLPTANEMQQRAAINEAEKAERYAQKLVAAAVEKQTLIEKLSKPSDLSRQEKVALAAIIIQRAVQNGLSEVELYRFSGSLCSDGGHAIIRQEVGWEETLTGIPLELYQLWSTDLKPRGYRIGYQTMDRSGSPSGNITVVLSWGG